MSQTLQLLPTPRQVVFSDSSFSFSDGNLILLDGPDPKALRRIAARFQRALREKLGLNWEVVAGHGVPPSLVGLSLSIHPGCVPRPQGYELTICSQGITAVAQDEPGLFYAICTLVQIIEQSGRVLPCLHIADWPDFPARGVMLDVSRDKVPTMETLYALVDMLAGWKINQLQLYMEHTFAYRKHREVWEKASPFTGQEILDLDEYCRERYIELVPNQNSFGHMNRWLSHPNYASLAEVNSSFDAPWGRMDGAYSLCPVDPASVEFLGGLYDELLPHFSSKMINVGCDEVFDVGQGRSRAACESLGAGRVYLQFLLNIYGEVKKRGHTMQFWGDIILKYPEFIQELPRDVIALEWGYEADYPFAENSARFAEAGIPFYVCPGTSSWSSIAGRTTNALGNLLHAAENGLKYGACGYMITDWGDNGHWQTLPISFLGLMAGSAYAWCLETNRGMDVASTLSRHAFRDHSGVMGRVAYDMGNVYRSNSIIWPYSSLLAGVLQSDFERIRGYRGLSEAGFRSVLAAIEAAMAPIPLQQMERPDANLIVHEYELAARLLRHACWRGLAALGADPGFPAHDLPWLDSDMQEIIEEYKQLWLARNRPGGLVDSIARFEKARQDYQMAPVEV